MINVSENRLVSKGCPGVGQNIEILGKRNKSDEYSLKLDRLFVEKFDVISSSPDTGRKTNLTSVRAKIIRHNRIYYRIYPDKIEILAIWDTMRNPKKFKL